MATAVTTLPETEKSPLTVAVERELIAAGRLETAKGAIALAAAERVSLSESSILPAALRLCSVSCVLALTTP